MEESAPAERVLDFWFGKIDATQQCEPAFIQRWWKKDPNFDQQLRDEFGALHTSVTLKQSRAERPSWMDSPPGLLAAIILVDQFSRNMFRGSAQMYKHDELAQAWSLEAVAFGYHQTLAAPHATFLLMPLMHSEKLIDQERCITLFTELGARLQGGAAEMAAKNASFAKQHRDIIAQFGRFPHRNALLGRQSSNEELTFLQQPGSSF